MSSELSSEVRVPALPESVADATVAAWHRAPGEAVKKDENLVDLETDKVVLEVPAPADGVLGEILAPVGAVVTAATVLATIVGGAPGAAPPAPRPAAPTAPAASPSGKAESVVAPGARRLVKELGLDPAKIAGSGRDGRVQRADVVAYLDERDQAEPARDPETVPITGAPQLTGEAGRPEQRVPMTRLRARVAERLLQAQQNAAMLTTFNEVNLKAVIELRNRYKDQFEKAHGVRLGFMSFFVKAAVEALQRFPVVNASVDGNDILYHGYFDLGIAVSSARGLVVPILRNCDQLSMAEIEQGISEFGRKAKDGTLSFEDLTGGTFSITNGGVFGSLLSTPILNPPQSAILGMHKTQERPIAENGQIVIAPMMYLALTYDHRIIDGREAVQFLVTIKETLEEPARLLLRV
ncbi:2-oxoglutarate dehydrogenase complex dihydrolipoyllysine-residue succinyltransferase [uncultured Lamprocystis sp.]|jgi:2-oxoglutarate dehydrogenase E2 component (dihydrolipoamide succinyltransferase)|uniref:2-oxoglutarate dehydrogenase complex dihydrolipoyllysine-residue succinyltransferase n=1 Tax=uncultured Lamprocystis sp. TaxID=543132 RepID=UPI0025D37E36|nr:2-oxoglutarate dehydrogenase complex dihydrolipoyllysine-residue succinyltransferase [uncultured Lamprocystis sp.]